MSIHVPLTCDAVMDNKEAPKQLHSGCCNALTVDLCTASLFTGRKQGVTMIDLS